MYKTFRTWKIVSGEQVYENCTMHISEDIFDLPDIQASHKTYYTRHPLETGIYSFSIQDPPEGFEFCISLLGGLEPHQILQDAGIVSDYRKALYSFDGFSTENEILTKDAKNLIYSIVGMGDLFSIKHFVKRFTQLSDEEVCRFNWADIIRIFALEFKERQTAKSAAQSTNGDQTDREYSPSDKEPQAAKYPADCKTVKDIVKYMLSKKPYLSRSQKELAEAVECTPARISQLIKKDAEIKAVFEAARSLIEYRTAPDYSGGYIDDAGNADRAIYDD